MLIKSLVLLIILTALIPFVLLQNSPAQGRQKNNLVPKSNHELDKLFSYDRAKGFDLREASVREQDGVSIRDISYAALGPQRARSKAFLIRPAGKGPFAGVLFFHWLGEPNGDRTQFLGEATAVAKQGAVSLLIEGYFPWVVQPTDGKTDSEKVVSETKEVRRALDLLLSQPQVDRKRIGYVGHDYGAMYGSIVAAVDKRVKAYALIAGIGSFSQWSLDYWLKARPAEFKKSYRQEMTNVEPINLIGQGGPAEFLFQFAETDKYISKEAALTFYEAAPQPKLIRWYPTTHEMNVAAARTDRQRWLQERIKLK